MFVLGFENAGSQEWFARLRLQFSLILIIHGPFLDGGNDGYGLNKNFN